jgi:hypothetical protein
MNRGSGIIDLLVIVGMMVGVVVAAASICA